MLVLERRPGESLTVTAPDGTVITVKVADLIGQKVMVGIDAPRDWKISRDERQQH